MAFTADIRLLQHRDVHHPEYRPVSIDQRDVDREFAVTVDELLGAIEWIDQPVALPVLPLFESRQPVFLRDDRQVGGQGLQPGDDAAMGCQVGLRQRGLVAFRLNAEIRGVDFEYCLTRLAGECDDGLNQILEVHALIPVRLGAQYRTVCLIRKRHWRIARRSCSTWTAPCSISPMTTTCG